MNEIKLQREGLDEYIDGLEVGETCDIYATIKVVSKSDSEIVASVEDVEKHDMAMESEDEMDGEEEGYESEEEAPMRKKHGKGLGILIMMGGPKGSK